MCCVRSCVNLGDARVTACLVLEISGTFDSIMFSESVAVALYMGGLTRSAPCPWASGPPAASSQRISSWASTQGKVRCARLCLPPPCEHAVLPLSTNPSTGRAMAISTQHFPPCSLHDTGATQGHGSFQFVINYPVTVLVTLAQPRYPTHLHASSIDDHEGDSELLAATELSAHRRRVHTEVQVASSLVYHASAPQNEVLQHESWWRAKQKPA